MDAEKARSLESQYGLPSELVCGLCAFSTAITLLLVLFTIRRPTTSAAATREPSMEVRPSGAAPPVLLTPTESTAAVSIAEKGDASLAKAAPPLRWLMCCLPQATATPPAPAAPQALDVTPSGSHTPKVMASSQRLGQCTCPFVDVTFDIVEGLAFPVLQLRGLAGGYDRHAGAQFGQAIEFIVTQLHDQRPFLVLYDFRTYRLPPPALTTQGVRAANAHAEAWDTQVQAIAVMLDSSIARGFLSMVVSITKSPQPVAFCATPSEAFTFLSTIRSKRSFASPSKSPARA